MMKKQQRTYEAKVKVAVLTITIHDLTLYLFTLRTKIKFYLLCDKVAKKIVDKNHKDYLHLVI